MKPVEEMAEIAALELYDCVLENHRGHVRSKFRQVIEAARREGAEEMRERAAEFADKWGLPDKHRDLPPAIRALPLEEETTRRNDDA